MAITLTKTRLEGEGNNRQPSEVLRKTWHVLDVLCGDVRMGTAPYVKIDEGEGPTFWETSVLKLLMQLSLKKIDTMIIP